MANHDQSYLYSRAHPTPAATPAGGSPVCGVVFFQSGLIKYQSWDSTLYLFEFEYQVPLVPWQLAAYLGTAAELILPIFVALGFLARPMTLALFVFNIVAVASYPLLWERGFDDHIMWGVILLVVSVWGPGWLNLDQRLTRDQKARLSGAAAESGRRAQISRRSPHRVRCVLYAS